MFSAEPITLKEIQLRLGVPQHVLIHLCEKGVIEPDFSDTTGRGKRREFSERNVFEFGVALALRRLEVPVSTMALVIRILRTFSRAVSKAVPGFVIPDAIREQKWDLVLGLYDGALLVLSAAGGPLKKPLILGAKLAADRSSDTSPRVTRLADLPSKYEVRIELNLTEIAQNTLK
jgi:DNA-binding transcriptional MerR regulator